MKQADSFKSEIDLLSEIVTLVQELVQKTKSQTTQTHNATDIYDSSELMKYFSHFLSHSFQVAIAKNVAIH